MRNRFFPICLSVLVMVVQLTQNACVIVTREVILPSPHQVATAHDILDLPISEIELHHHRMLETLDLISQSIERTSSGKLHFAYSIAASKALTEGQLMGKTVVVNNPRVSIKASKTTLRDVINELCREARMELLRDAEGL